MSEEETLTFTHSLPRCAQVKNRFVNRISSGDLAEEETRSPGRAFTAEPMIAYERDPIAVMRAARNYRELRRIGPIFPNSKTYEQKTSAR